MAVVKDLIVVKVGELSPSKYDWPYHRVILKSIDETDKSKYLFNLNKKTDSKENLENYKNWLKNCIEGNVLRVSLQEKNPKNVNQWREFKVIKSVRKNKSPEVTSETIVDDMISIELEKISKYSSLIQKASDEIERLTKQKIIHRGL